MSSGLSERAHQDQQVTRSDSNADPAILLVADVKVAAAFDNESDLLIFVQMS